MKKLFAVLLSFALAASLSACGMTEEKPSTPADTTADKTIDKTIDQAVDSTADTTTNATVDSTTDTTVEATVYATIEATDCFSNAGYVEFISGAEKAAEYTFTAENSEAAKWCVYVLDEEFDDGFRFIAQAAQPALEGDGTISVAEGQYVYVYCSVNSFTADAADENAKLNITVK